MNTRGPSPVALAAVAAIALALVAAGCSGGDGADGAPDTGPSDSRSDGAADVFVPGEVAAVDAGGDARGDTGGAQDIAADAGPPPAAGFPSDGLVVRVVSPGGGRDVALASAVTPIHGVLFGRPETLRWESDAGDEGTLEPAPFWTIPAVALEPGDNVITITAAGPDGEASDRVVVTWNPSFSFVAAPGVVPPALFAGEPTEVHVSVPLGRAANFDAGTVALHRVAADGQTVARIVDLVDDGDPAGSGDEIEGDGRFSGRATLVCDPADPLVVRVTLQATTSTTQYRALSALVPIPCVDRIAPTRCKAVRTRLLGARAVRDDALATAGTPDYDAATTAAADWLAGEDGVAAAGGDPESGGVWLLETGGLLGAAHLGAPGHRGGAAAPAERSGDEPTARIEAALSGVGHVGSRRTLLLDPWGDALRPADEVGALADALAADGCPGYAVDGPHQGDHASLDRLRSLAGHGLVALAARGGTYFGALGPSHREALGWRGVGARTVVWTGEPVDCDALLTGPVACALDADCAGDQRCLRTRPGVGACFDALQVDLALGRVVVGPDTWGVLPAFFDAHAGPLPDAVVYLGSCGSLQVGGLAAALYAAGARAVFGWSGPVTSTFATAHGGALFDALLDGREAAAALPADPTDPEAGGGLALFGVADLDAAPAGVLNGGFESGDLRGWDVGGDVRPLERLGATTAVEGQRFAVVSTGLGLSRRGGTLRQTLCVPREATGLSFWWKVISEEIPLNCGSVNQDRVRVVVRGAATEVVAVDATVDDLCAPSACPGCGDEYGPLSPADIGFDRGVASQTAWRRTRVDLLPFVGGGPVVFEVTVSDKGDSTWDTAALIDGVVLQ